MKPLFEITAEMHSLIERLETAISEDHADMVNYEELFAWLCEIDNQAKEKIDAYGWVIRMLESEADQAREIRDDFERKLQVRKRRIELLKDMLKNHLLATGQTKVEGKAFKVALQKNGGALPVEVFDETIIPDQFFRVVKEVSKSKILDAIEAGIEVPGAMLGERGQSVRIR